MNKSAGNKSRAGKGTFQVPDELRQVVRDLLEQQGQHEASRRLGISRLTILSIAAGLPIRAGSLALIRQNLRLDRLKQRHEQRGTRTQETEKPR